MVEAICGRLGVVAVPHADLVEAASIRLGCLCSFAVHTCVHVATPSPALRCTVGLEGETKDQPRFLDHTLGLLDHYNGEARRHLVVDAGSAVVYAAFYSR